jgi:hypothetical protein
MLKTNNMESCRLTADVKKDPSSPTLPGLNPYDFPASMPLSYFIGNNAFKTNDEQGGALFNIYAPTFTGKTDIFRSLAATCPNQVEVLDLNNEIDVREFEKSKPITVIDNTDFSLQWKEVVNWIISEHLYSRKGVLFCVSNVPLYWSDWVCREVAHNYTLETLITSKEYKSKVFDAIRIADKKEEAFSRSSPKPKFNTLPVFQALVELGGKGHYLELENKLDIDLLVIRQRLSLLEGLGLINYTHNTGEWNLIPLAREAFKLGK